MDNLLNAYNSAGVEIISEQLCHECFIKNLTYKNSKNNGINYGIQFESID